MERLNLLGDKTIEALYKYRENRRKQSERKMQLAELYNSDERIAVLVERSQEFERDIRPLKRMWLRNCPRKAVLPERWYRVLHKYKRVFERKQILDFKVVLRSMRDIYDDNEFNNRIENAITQGISYNFRETETCYLSRTHSITEEGYPIYKWDEYQKNQMDINCRICIPDPQAEIIQYSFSRSGPGSIRDEHTFYNKKDALIVVGQAIKLPQEHLFTGKRKNS